MIGLLLAFAIGVWGAQQQAALVPHSVAWLWVVSIAFLSTIVSGRAIFLFREKRVASVLSQDENQNGAQQKKNRLRGFRYGAALLLALLIGFFYANFRATIRLADALPSAVESEPLIIVGVIDSLPNVDENGTHFTLGVEQVEAPAKVKIPSHIALGWFANAQQTEVPHLYAGERWRLAVRLKRPHGFSNPHGFDVEAWMLENNIRANGSVSGGGDSLVNQRLAADAGRLQDRVARWRERVRTHMQKQLNDARWRGVLVALAMGDQQSISSADWALFNRTGISHLLSISGAHVTLFATALAAAVYALWRRVHPLTLRLPARKAAAIAAFCAAGIYALLAGFAVPAQRTFYMLTVAAIGLWFGRSGSGAAVLAWALGVVLFLDPWAVFGAGFWFSFIAVAMLLWLGANRVGRVVWWRAAVVTQLAISVAMAPVALALFQQVSVVGLLVNAIAIPLVSFIVVPLTLLWLVVPLEALLRIAHGCVAALVQLLHSADQMPLALWQQQAPPAWSVVLALAGAFWLIAPRAIPGKPLALLMMLPMFTVTPSRPDDGAFTVTALDVGQGLAIAVQTKSYDLLYDTGPRWTDTTDAGARIIVPYLRATGAQLGAVIVSHQDSDHSGGAAAVFAARSPSWWMSSLHEAFPLRKVVQSPHHRCVVGQTWVWDRVTFSVVHPQAKHYNENRKTNDLSCVIRVSNAAGASALLTGDAEALSERNMIESRATLAAGLLTVPHHGSGTSSTPEFIEKIAPQVAVVNAGYRNRFGHPRAEVLARYGLSTIDRTDWHGAVKYEFENGKWKSLHHRNLRRRYWTDLPERDARPLD